MTMEQAMGEDFTSRVQQCPGCLRPVDPLRAPAVSVVNGKLAHFCSQTCRERYLKREPEPVPAFASVEAEETSQEETIADVGAPGDDVVEPRPSRASMFPHLDLYSTKILRPQIVQAAVWACVAAAVVALPGKPLSGMLPVAAAAVGIVAMGIFAIIRMESGTVRRMLEVLSVPFAALATAASSFFDVHPRYAALFAVALPAVEAAGRLSELYFRRRSGVLQALDAGEEGAIPSSWRDNSRTAEAARSLAAMLEWGRFPAAVVAAVLVFAAAKSVGLCLISFAAAIVSLNPRTIRMTVGDAHLRAALRAAARNVVIRDADAVCRAARAKTILFIAKRTLVKPESVATDWKFLETANPKTVLDAAATLEASAEGRFAEPIRLSAVEQRARVASNVEVARIPGKGIVGETPFGPAVLGSRSLLLEKGISTGLLESHAQKIEESGRRAVFVALDNVCAAVLAVEEPTADGAVRAIQELRQIGIETAMLTSAEVVPAQAVAARLGIETVFFETAEEKVGEVLRGFSDSGGHVLLVGSGAAFEEHFRGADAAIALCPDDGVSQAGFNVATGTIGVVPHVVHISRQAERSAVTNLVLSIGVSLLGVGLAIAGPSGPVCVAAATFNALASAASAANAPFPMLAKSADLLRTWIRRLFKKRD